MGKGMKGLHKKLIELGYEKCMEIYSDSGDDSRITEAYRQSVRERISDNLRLKIPFVIVPAELVPDAVELGAYLPHTHVLYQKSP